MSSIYYKRKRNRNNPSYRYASQPFDNEQQYYRGFASGSFYVRGRGGFDDFQHGHVPTNYGNGIHRNAFGRLRNYSTVKYLKNRDTTKSINTESSRPSKREVAENEPTIKLYVDTDATREQRNLFNDVDTRIKELTTANRTKVMVMELS